MVRAKFRVDSVTHTVNGSVVELNAVQSGNPENESFFRWTPSGKISMGVINSHAAKEFVPGQEMYVDFHHVPEDHRETNEDERRLCRGGIGD